MRIALVALCTMAALAACGSVAAGPSSGTALSISYWERGLESGEPTRWTLRCDPARGTLARPAVACRRLDGVGTKVFAGVPRNAACTEIYGGPQVARVVGAVEGKRVWATFNRANGCHISRWNGVAPWLLPRAGVGA